MNEKGQPVRLFDRDNDREVLPAGSCANVLEIYEDKPLNFDNWDVDLFHLLKHEEIAAESSPELILNDALRLVLRFRYRYHRSRFEQDVVFHADSRRIDFETRAEWYEDHRLLKAAFPVDIRIGCVSRLRCSVWLSRTTDFIYHKLIMPGSRSPGQGLIFPKKGMGSVC